MAHPASMADCWAAIEGWLAVHAPPIRDALAPGATAADLDTLRRRLRCDPPGDLVEVLRVHNGQNPGPPSARLGWIPFTRPDGRPGPACALYDCRSIAHVHKVFRELTGPDGDYDGARWSEWRDPPRLDPGVRDECWHRRVVLFCDSGSGEDVLDYYGVDLDPAPGGTPGQVLQYFRDWEAPPRVVAGSFGDWFRQLAADIASGRFVRDRRRGLVPVETG